MDMNSTNILLYFIIRTKVGTQLQLMGLQLNVNFLDMQ